MNLRKSAFAIKNYCVACGTCISVCPKGRRRHWEIPFGIQAKVNFEDCIGCGKCRQVCPADSIIMKEKVMMNEK